MSTEMCKSVQRYAEVYRVMQRCTEMYRGAQEYACKDVQRTTERAKVCRDVQRVS